MVLFVVVAAAARLGIGRDDRFAARMALARPFEEVMAEIAAKHGLPSASGGTPTAQTVHIIRVRQAAQDRFSEYDV